MLVVVAMIAVVVGGVATVVALRLQSGTKLEAARRQRTLMLDEARRDADSTRREAAVAALRPEPERARELAERLGHTPKTMAQLRRKGFGADSLETAFGDVIAGNDV